MKPYLLKLVLLLILFETTTIYGQGIRKDYKEMTQFERDDYVAAVFLTQDQTNLYSNQANFHDANFGVIHGNLFINNPPAYLQNDQFLPWHRQNSLFVENDMQNQTGNFYVSLPYWNWFEDDSSSDPLWNQNFLGQFDNPVIWANLNRQFINGQLPSITDLNNALNETDWFTFTHTRMEFNSIHVGGHVFVNGVMAQANSPLDPVFYLHHNMVDKIWQQWHLSHPTSSTFQRTMLTGFPSVNPNDIIDSRDIGVFYAEDQYVNLNNYTVSNSHKVMEVFYYQYFIEAEENFTIPQGKNAIIESCLEIKTGDGFNALTSSDTWIKIDGDCNFHTINKSKDGETTENEFARRIPKTNGLKEPIKDTKAALAEPVYITLEDIDGDDSGEIKIIPNPNHGEFKVHYENVEQGIIQIFDSNGNKILEQNIILTEESAINIKEYPAGIYIVKVINSSGKVLTEKALKN